MDLKLRCWDTTAPATCVVSDFHDIANGWCVRFSGSNDFQVETYREPHWLVTDTPVLTDRTERRVLSTYFQRHIRGYNTKQYMWISVSDISVNFPYMTMWRNNDTFISVVAFTRLKTNFNQFYIIKWLTCYINAEHLPASRY